MSESKNVKVIVLCSNSEGAPEFHSCAIDVTQEQYDNGDHYDLAMENAEDNGYEPHKAFDQNDPAAKQLGDIFTWLQAQKQTSMEIKGTYSSVWDGGYHMETNCTIDLETGAVDAESTSESASASVEIFERAFVTVNDREFKVEDEVVTELAELQAFVKTIV